MTPTLAQVNNWFNEYNASIFDNKLPKVPIRFNNTRRQLGQFHWGVRRGTGIQISLYYDRPEKEYRNTLVHEMCHLYCYTNGWTDEHHGYRWRSIAGKASAITGMNIQRIHEGSQSWSVAQHNQHKEAQRVAKKTAKMSAPAILVDLDYGTYHFVVRTSPKVLSGNDATTSDCRLKTTAKSYKVYVSDAPYFRRMVTTRSLHRGYKYKPADYDRTIKPLLAGAKEIDVRTAIRGRF